MSARAKLEHLAKFLQKWSAKMPEGCEVADPLDLFDNSLLLGDLELRRIAGEELLRTSQLLQDIASTVGTASLHLTSCGQEANSLQAPMRLPFELLSRIFTMGCQPSEHAPCGTPEFFELAECRETRLAIAWSCSHFRRVLQMSPIAWVHIPVMMCGYYAPLREIRGLISLEISMSGTCPISFYVFVEQANYNETGGVARYWEFLRENISSVQDRLRALVIVADQSFLSPRPLSILPEGNIVLTLTSLEISAYQGDGMAVSLDIRNFPALEVLSINYRGWSMSTFGEGMVPLVITSGPHSVIRSLSISGNIGMESFVNIIVSCQKFVEEIRWVEAENELPLPSGVIHLPRLRKLHLEVDHLFSFLDPSRHTMPNLTDLTLGDRNGSVSHSVGVDTIILPSLQSRHIGPSAWRHSTLQAFFWANPTIQTLSTPADISDVATFFIGITSRPGDILPNLEGIIFVAEIYGEQNLDRWCELIRARKTPFNVCFENIPQKWLARHLYESYPDIVGIEEGY